MNGCDCMKTDSYGECECASAEFDVRKMTSTCMHDCVNRAVGAYENERRARLEAERKLEKYRKAIQPFVANCHAVIDAVEGGEE